MQTSQSSSPSSSNQRNNSGSTTRSGGATTNGSSSTTRSTEGSLPRSKTTSGSLDRKKTSIGKNRSSPANNGSNNNRNESTPASSRNQNTFNYPTRILTFGFPFSGQPDIVRSSQKDEFYSNHVMFNNLKELCNWFFGQRFTIRFEREIQLVCNLIYYGTTTCTGQSTLGEEYCDLLQVQLKEKTKPQNLNSNPNKFSPKTLYIVKSTSSTRLLFVLYELIVPYLFDRGTSHWLSHYLSPNGISENMRYYISMLKEFVQFILRFNLASFYINGKFLQVSKRLAGIRYVSSLTFSIR